MSALKFKNGPEPGQHLSDGYGYSQSINIPGTNLVKLSGQGGWDSTGTLDATNTQLQVEQAFDNVDKQLQAQGLRGWEDVYLFRTYATDMDASFQFISDTLRKRCADHRPCWTALSVPRLALKEMLIEIEVEAYRTEEKA